MSEQTFSDNTESVETSDLEGADVDETPTEKPVNDVDSLPDFAKKMIADLRKESASYRTKAKAHDEALNAQKTDAEKAIDAAKAEARAEYGQKLAAAEIRAALAGVVDKPSDIIEDLNLAKYVGEDGEVDSDAVETLKKRIEGMVGARRKGASGNGMGRAGGTAGQKSKGDMLAETLGFL